MLRLKMKLRDTGKDLGKLQENTDEYNAVCKKIDDLIAKGKTVKKHIKTIEAGTTALPKEGGAKCPAEVAAGKAIQEQVLPRGSGDAGQKDREEEEHEEEEGEKRRGGGDE